MHGSLGLEELPEALADVGIVGDHLGDDIRRAGQCVLHSLHTLLGVNTLLGQHLGRGQVLSLGEEQQCQGLQALLPGGSGAGAALLLIGAVEILHLGQGLGPVDGGGKLVGELSLGFDGRFHLFPAGI